MVILHQANFKDYPTVKDYLLSNTHWVACSDNNTDWKPTDMTQDKIYKRVTKTNEGYLQIERFASEPMDVINGVTLRPRIEIQPVYRRLPRQTPIHIRYVVSLIEGGTNFRGMIFQIMDHTNTGATLPVFQFEMRNGDLHTRWCQVSEQGESIKTEIFKIATPKWNASEWHTLDVFVYLSHTSNGYIRVYRNGVFVWDRKAINASQNPLNPMVSFGIYAVPGFDLKTQVKSLMYETIDKIPDTSTLTPSTGPTGPTGTSKPSTGPTGTSTGPKPSTGPTGTGRKEIVVSDLSDGTWHVVISKYTV